MYTDKFFPVALEKLPPIERLWWNSYENWGIAALNFSYNSLTEIEFKAIILFVKRFLTV